jgi:uncharacterized MAPEG superfamily protein
MTPELTILALAALLQCGQFLLYAVLANIQVGSTKTLAPRDTPIPLTGMAGRAQRAMNNHFEGLILFTIAILVVYLSDSASSLTANIAWAYLAARVLYVPAYLFGWVPWRSIIWAVGWFATVLLLAIPIQ